MPIRDVNVGVQVDSYELTEIQGNWDGTVNPGESFNLRIHAANYGLQSVARGVVGQVTSLSPYVVIWGSNQVSFGDIEPEETVEGDTTVYFTVDISCPDAVSRSFLTPQLAVMFTSGQNSWRSILQVDPEAPDFEVVATQDESVPMDGQVHEISFRLKNRGRQNSERAEVQLLPQTYGLQAENNQILLDPLAAGAETAIDQFTVSAPLQAIPGARIEMLLVCVLEGGFTDSAHFSVTVGQPAQNTPLGPDNYGYICYDDTDQGWDAAPDYDWIEISPREQERDFNGTPCAFTGRTLYDIGETEVVELDFQTQFYGHLYDRITISTNGYLAMGDQEMVSNFENWPLDKGIGGGVGMIAPFWDWLRFQESSQVCYHHVEAEGIFIIEWYKLRHHDNGERDLTFEVILYDHAAYITDSGDQPIQFNYRSIQNIQGAYAERSDMPFASVGISSPDGLSGINYTFYNQYPTAAAPLANQRALRFEVGGLPQPPCQFNLLRPENDYVSPTIDIDFQWTEALDPNPRAIVKYYLAITAQDDTREYPTDANHLMLNFYVQGYNIDWLKANDAVWRVTAISGRDTVRSLEQRRFRLAENVGSPRMDDGLPWTFGFQSIAPNPLNSTAALTFRTTESGRVQLSVFDVRGREVATLFDGETAAGSHVVCWDASDIAAGVYLLRLTSGACVSMRKAVLVK